MRPRMLGGLLGMAVLISLSGNAQVLQLPTPPPQVTAAGESWQAAGEPVFYEGNYYYPAGATVFFDGNIMARTGVYRGVPLYQDRTLEPYSIVLVPIGGRLMKPYERRRTGELAGTTGSRAPAWPIERDAETRRDQTREVADMVQAGPVGDSTAPSVANAARDAVAPAPQPTSLIMLGREPTGRQGVWIEFDNARWFNKGDAVIFDSNMYVQSGEYRGFPVYRTQRDAGAIFVPSVPGGLLARYTR